VGILVIDAEKIDQSWSTYTLRGRQRMSTLDEIIMEKQRVGIIAVGTARTTA
jgi:hypothetical protein